MNGRQTQPTTKREQRISELEQQKVDLIIAGCTELPLLVPDISSSIPIIDPTLILAKAVVKYSLEV